MSPGWNVPELATNENGSGLECGVDLVDCTGYDTSSITLQGEEMMSLLVLSNHFVAVIPWERFEFL